MEDSTCKDAPTLGIKVDNLARRHDELVVYIKESISELKNMMKVFVGEIRDQIKEDKAVIDKLEVLNNEQQTRLALLEEKQKDLVLETQEQGKTIETHGKRLAQGGAVVLAVSLLMPVVLEHWLGQRQPPHSEVGAALSDEPKRTWEEL